jgi:hypothetical protein
MTRILLLPHAAPCPQGAVIEAGAGGRTGRGGAIG